MCSPVVTGLAGAFFGGSISSSVFSTDSGEK